MILAVNFFIKGVVGRFSQVNPKILFAVDAVMYNGKRHDQLEKLKKIVNGEKIIYYKLLSCILLPVSHKTFVFSITYMELIEFG